MIAALYCSRTSGSKRLTLDGTLFGWQTIEKIYSQEMERAEGGQSRKVPGLKYAFVYRDNWTHLNVRPAKIMQVTNLFNPKCFTLENNFIASKVCSRYFWIN